MEEQGEFMKKLFETASDASRKRKSEDDDDKDEGPALVDATFRVYDDAHKKISWDIREQDQNLIIARCNLRETFSYYIFVPHFVLQKSIIGSLPLSRREQKYNQDIVLSK